jgi:phage terminase large subunit GpA-like protein
MTSQEARLLATAQDTIRPSFTGDVVQWVEDNVNDVPDSMIRGKLSLKRTPWLAEALRILTDPETKLGVVIAATQSGKSLLQRLYALWQIVNAPAPFMMLQPTDPEAKDFFIRYVRPLINQCPPAKALLSDGDNDKSTVADFTNGVTLYCRGAWNEGNLQRLSLRTVIMDEAWMYPRGHILEASARTQAFSWMGRVLAFGQAGNKGDEFHSLYDSTDQRVWHFACPSCSKLQPWLWEFIRFPEEAKVGGMWDTKLVEVGTTYECAHCQVRLKDTPGVRAEANNPERGAGFKATSTGSSWGNVGLHWNCLINSSWGKESVRALKAKESADLYGDESGRRVWKQKRLALPWSEDGGEIASQAKAGDYSLGDDWDMEAKITGEARVVDIHSSNIPDGSVPFRTLSIDVQRGFFFAEVRSWSKTGHSRLRWFGKVDTWQQLDDLAKLHQVNKALAGVDSGDQTQEVYAQCAARGWKALRGSGQADFTVQDMGTKTTKRFYSDKQLIFVPGQARRCEMIVWSNLATKDLLAGLQKRRLHTYARNVPDDYVAQLTAECRVKDSRSGKAHWIMPAGKTAGNHAWDCACMGVILAVRWGIIGRDVSEEERPGAQPEGGLTQATDGAG